MSILALKLNLRFGDYLSAKIKNRKGEEGEKGMEYAWFSFLFPSFRALFAFAVKNLESYVIKSLCVGQV
jgi:hypothetical protein